MGVNLSTFSFKKIPRALILFLVLAILFEGAVLKLNRVPGYAAKKQVVEKMKIDTDVLFIGDSSLSSGLDTALFEKMTGLRSFSYGTMQVLGMPSYYLLLRDYLRHQKPPRFLVIMIVPQVWATEVGGHFNSNFSYFFSGDEGLFHILNQGLSWPLFFRYFILNRIPSVLHRGYLSDILFTDRRAVYESEYGHSKRGMEAWIANRGAVLIEDKKYKLDCKGDKKMLGDEAYRLSTESNYYLGRILSLAASHRIQTFYVASPFARECFSSEQMEQVTQMNRKIMGAHPEMIPLQPETLGYPQEKFSNTSFHLNKSNAQLFTIEIARKMKERLADYPK